MKPFVANCYVIMPYEKVKIKETIKCKETITLKKGSSVYATIYGAWMAMEDLRCHAKRKNRRYVIYRGFIDPNDLAYPYSFEDARSWYTGRMVLSKTETFQNSDIGTLTYHRPFNGLTGDNCLSVYSFRFEDYDSDEGFKIRSTEYGFNENETIINGHFSNCWFVRAPKLTQEQIDIDKEDKL